VDALIGVIDSATDLFETNMIAAANIQITWSEELARAGYDHRFGARPLQRVIEKRVAVTLARCASPTPRRVIAL